MVATRMVSLGLPKTVEEEAAAAAAVLMKKLRRSIDSLPLSGLLYHVLRSATQKRRNVLYGDLHQAGAGFERGPGDVWRYQAVARGKQRIGFGGRFHTKHVDRSSGESARI